jgi:two-component system, sensor histidine kinase RegB
VREAQTDVRSQGPFGWGANLSRGLGEGMASPRDLLSVLILLRWLAVAGQSLTVFVASYFLNISLPLRALLMGIGVLLIFNVLAGLRMMTFARRLGPVGPAEVFIHMLVDVAVLSYLLALTGGSSNPFFPLHLVPVALASVTLPVPWVIGVGAVTLLCASVTVYTHLPLPVGMVDVESPMFRFGVWISFALCLMLLSVFLVSLAKRWRDQQHLLHELREQTVRSESVVALASQAASVAHELNTPLSTVATVVADLRHQYLNDDELGPDLKLMDDQLRLCRDYIRELVELSRSDAQPRPMAVTRLVELAVGQVRLLQPDITVKVTPLKSEPALSVLADRSVVHVVVGLLNNAADASRANASERVEVTWHEEAGRLTLAVRDFGKGLSPAQRGLAESFGYTTKSSGLGLGLALGRLTADRFGGELSLSDAGDGPGTVAEFVLPLHGGDTMAA